MEKKPLYAAWAFLYIVCAVLGFIPEPTGFLYYLMIALSLIFFVPPFLLLIQGVKAGNLQTLRVIRTLSALSLGSTVVMFLLNVLSVGAGEIAGEMVYTLLILVSSPMVCCRFWILSLFLWACLLMGSILQLKKKN